MDNNDQIQKLEERIKYLENMLNNITFNEAKEVALTNCPIGEITIGQNCKLVFQQCSIGSVIDTDIDDADSRIDDLESRLDEINDKIDETEDKLDELEDSIDEMEEKLNEMEESADD